MMRWKVLNLIILFLILPIQSVEANMNQSPGGGRFYLSCVDDNTCQLTPTPIGEETVSGQSTANMIQKETLNFEFYIAPVQSH
ncbi:MAG: hypothetical protein VW270_19515, partial [Candidatus Poseidoniales archaeon]